MYHIKSLQKAFIRQLEKEAEKIGTTVPHNLYQPIQYTLNMGGKRLRPVMVLMACELFGGNPDTAMSAAIGIEVFHNFTLLHDDIMDHASLRRNMQTVHKRYSTNVAILSGDAMSNLSYLYLLKTQSPSLNEILTLFSQTAMQVCEGQQYDMDFETSMAVSIDDYMEMIRLKTAVLIACSLKTGALIGNAPAREATCLYHFGINLGLAFQLQDDLLDIYANQDKFGKKIGGDIIANKKTFLLLKSLELANPEQKNELIRWLSIEKCDRDEKVNAVRKIFDETGIRKITREIMDQYYQKAVAELDTMTLHPDQKEKLYHLAKQIMKRDK